MAKTAKRPEIATETVCRIVVKALQFDAKEDVGDSDPGSNPADDGFRGIFEDRAGDPVREELTTFIDGLDVDDRSDLVALLWVGRGDFGADEWARARGLAAQQQDKPTSAYLLGTPLLADYLRDGLASFGLSCEEFESRG